jgi:hypothetical protein
MPPNTPGSLSGVGMMDRREELKYIERGSRPFSVITGLPCATCRYGDKLPEELRMTPFQHEAWHVYYAFNSLQPFAYGRERFHTDKVIERFMKRMFWGWDWPIHTATRHVGGVHGEVPEKLYGAPFKKWKVAPTVKSHAFLEATYRVLDSYLGDDGESDEPPPMPPWWDPEHPNQAGAFWVRVRIEAFYDLRRRLRREKPEWGRVSLERMGRNEAAPYLNRDSDAFLEYLRDDPTRQLVGFVHREQTSARLNRFVRYLPREQQRATKLFLQGASPEQAAEAIKVEELRKLGRDDLADTLAQLLRSDADMVEWTHDEILRPTRERYEQNVKQALNNPVLIQNMRDGYVPPERIRLF